MLTNVYHLIKPNRYNNSLGSTSNIFQNCYINIYEEMKEKISRPVGGITSFNRQKMRRERKISLRNISSANKKPKQSQLEEQKVKEQQSFSEDENGKLLQDLNKEEQYKSHSKFRPSTAMTFKTKSNFNSKNTNSKVALKVPDRTINWADEQIEDFNQKSAMLSEVVYKQTLIQRYGDRYFQYCLRDRYKEDLSPPSYIYQVSGKQSRTKNKFRETFYKLRPDIKSRQRLILKGSHIRCGTPLI